MREFKDAVIFVGADPGNSALKLAYFIGNEMYYKYIPNVTGLGITLSEPPSVSNERCLAVKVLSSDVDEFRSEIHFIGDLARQQLQGEAEQNRDRKKVETESINLILPAALGLFSESRKIVLGIGATLTDIGDQALLLQRKMTRRHKIWYQYGTMADQTIEPEVIETYPFGQCLGGMIGLLRTGQVNKKEWGESTVLGLDFGHGQVNIAILDKLERIERACFSLDHGFYKIASAVQDYLNAAPYYVTASIPEIQEVVEKGYYMKHGKKIDLTAVITEACNGLMDLIYREAESKLVKVSKVLYDKISKIVVMGGGGPTMAPFVGSKYGINPIIAPESVFTNAIGLAWIARNKWEQAHG